MAIASFRTLSPYIRIYNFLLALRLLNIPKTATGSVAEIRDPNANE